MLNERRSARSAIGDRIRMNGMKKVTPAVQTDLEDAKNLKEEITEIEEQVAELEERLLAVASAIPNNSHPDSPIGPASAAVTLSTHGPVPIPASPSRDHIEVGRKLGLFDFNSASLVSGSSWYYLTNEGALLEMALTNYALSIAIKNGFLPVTTPDVVRSDIASRCGFLPRDQFHSPASQMYRVVSSDSPTLSSPELVLAGTAEIPLAGMFANTIQPAAALPINVVGLGRAFRAEAGARGHDTRGLYRVHQFTKLELFSVTAKEQSEEMMETMKQIQIEILEGLGLSFRCVC
jgi:seryl-tRNA synthetase